MLKSEMQAERITYSEYADQNEESYFEEMPISIEMYLEENKFTGTERIHRLRDIHFYISCWIMRRLADKEESRTESTTVATRAQKKLRHIVLMG